MNTTIVLGQKRPFFAVLTFRFFCICWDILTYTDIYTGQLGPRYVYIFTFHVHKVKRIDRYLYLWTCIYTYWYIYIYIYTHQRSLYQSVWYLQCAHLQVSICKPLIVFAALWLQVAVELLDWMRSGARGPMVTPVTRKTHPTTCRFLTWANLSGTHPAWLLL